MLKKALTVALICAAELAVLFLLRPQPVPDTDVAALNALVQEIENSGENYAPAAQGWTVTILDLEGSVLYRSGEARNETPLQAAAAGRIVLPIRQGTLIAERPGEGAEAVRSREYFALAVSSVLLSGGLMLLYAFCLDRRIVRPFRHVQSAAEAIAAGHLDLPLDMDRGGIFGPFTESFDLMRSELARSQAAQAKAAADKQDLIAKLSHDLRTPVASIQAVSELGALTAAGADRPRFAQIAGKAVQLNVLVSNLLNASLEEESELTVMTRPVPSSELQDLLAGADYQHWLTLTSLPACSVQADPVRLQQIFDNIFVNAYKYGRAPISAAGFIQDGDLLIELEDAGGGVELDETGSLHLRRFRGRNAEGQQGAGLGLYICDQLLRAMHGELIIRNGAQGLQVTVALPLMHNSPQTG